LLALLLVLGVAPSLVTRDVDPAVTRVIIHVDPGGTTDVGEVSLARTAEGEQP
jgi:hypothetical protein